MVQIKNLNLGANKRIRLIPAAGAASDISASTGAIAKDGENILICLAPLVLAEDWTINTEVTMNSDGTVVYSGFRIAQSGTYDSYADFDLETAIARSLHDADMQQWQAVKDAANELTGSDEIVWDSLNGVIEYNDPDAIFFTNSYGQILQFYTGNQPLDITSNNPYIAAEKLARHVSQLSGTTYLGPIEYSPDWGSSPYSTSITNPVPDGNIGIRWWVRDNNDGREYFLGTTLQQRADSNQNHTIEKLNVSFSQIAQKIISNASLSNQAISLLAETFLQTVANSIFTTDESKQFVKLADLFTQLEANKTLRV